MTTIFWFRRDLRLADNPALHAALAAGRLLPVYIHAPEEEGPSAPGAASRWWLHHSLAALDGRLRALGSRLVLRRGPAGRALAELVAETGAERVVWNRLYDPALIERDRAIKQRLREQGVAAESFNARLWHEPWTIAKKDGTPYRVFTPFWKACLHAGLDAAPLACPECLPPVPEGVESLPLSALALLPRVRWDDGLRENWTPGEDGAWDRLDAFLPKLGDYHQQRDRMDLDGTSRLSPHLHFGEISPRQIHARLLVEQAHPLDRPGSEAFLRELGWREFSQYLLYHFPTLVDQPLDKRFEQMPWRQAGEALTAWQQGRTGIPVVDAAMHELWHCGWMHNRARMIVASLLTKHMLIDWREGARWFHDTLVDADLASNVASWQWVAGSGADAAPYFRIFNPVLQGEKFDPTGRYVRRWVPALASRLDKRIHHPQEAGASGISGYSPPVVDLRLGRQRALAAFDRIKHLK